MDVHAPRQKQHPTSSRCAGRRRRSAATDGTGWLRERLGPLAERVPTEEAPGDELPPLVIHNERARQELGFRPRPVEETIVDTVVSMRDLGMLPAQG